MKPIHLERKFSTLETEHLLTRSCYKGRIDNAKGILYKDEMHYICILQIPENFSSINKGKKAIKQAITT